MRSADTSPEIHAVQIEIYRNMTPARRLELAIEMTAEANAISARSIRSRHPDYSDDEVQWALLRLRFGDDLFRKAWPDARLVAP
ncbi:MAG: hypothetical protein ACRDZN_02915 [Acidimicrobiales bacterium]